jgi:hypothetical protein
MAMEDPVLFTGRELNFEVPKMTELNSAEQRLRDKITKQEDLQTKYQDEIRKNLNIDTQALVSDFSRKQQWEAVKEFQNKWTKIAKERGNKLTSDDLMEMEKDRSGIANLQNEWKSSQALWEQDQAMIKKSPADFDIAKFTADTDAFLSTGQYKPNSLEFSGINMDDFFSGERWAGSVSTTEDAVAGSDGFDTYTQRSVNATPEEAKRHILQVVLSDSTGRALKGIMNDFTKEDEATKYKYLKEYGVDKDQDGKISSEEMAAANVKMSSRNILTNPILMYAQDKYLPSVLKEKVVTDKRRRPNPVQTGATVSESYVDENGVRVNISQRNVPASAVPEKKTTTKTDEGIPLRAGFYILNSGEAPIQLDKAQDFAGVKKVISVKAGKYNPSTNKVTVTFVTKKGSKTQDLDMNTVLNWADGPVKENILNQVIQVDGKPIKLGDFAGGGVKPTPEGQIDIGL